MSNSSGRARGLAARLIEPGAGFRRGIADLPRNLNAFTISTGVIPAMVIFVTFAALQVNSLSQLGFSERQIIAWVAVSYAFGGLIGIVLSLYYKMPIAGAWAIPGFVLVAATLETSSPAEAFGGFWLAGLFVLLLGVTGAIRKVVGLLPMPVMMGMVAGILLQFPVGIVDSFQESAIIVGAGLVATSSSTGSAAFSGGSPVSLGRPSSGS